jgi:hypothetical protein
LLLAQAPPTKQYTPARLVDLFLSCPKSLSCPVCSIILKVPNAVVFLVHGTGFIALRAPKSSPQMKQNPWFERFKVLGQNTNVPLGQNLEG